MSATDAEGDTITDYQFWDGSSGADSGYFWTPENAHWAASTTINVSASELSNLWIRAGSSVGAEKMYVRAFDGASWSNWDSFNFSSTTATPVASINEYNLSANQWAQVVNWTSVSDADGDAISKYQFWDSNGAANSGYFWTPENSRWASSTTIEVDASDLNDVWVRAGAVAGSDTMYVRAFDSTAWSSWNSFVITVISASRQSSWGSCRTPIHVGGPLLCYDRRAATRRQSQELTPSAP